MQILRTYWFAFVFACVVDKNPCRDPQLSPWLTTPLHGAVYEVWDLPCIYFGSKWSAVGYKLIITVLFLFLCKFFNFYLFHFSFLFSSFSFLPVLFLLPPSSLFLRIPVWWFPQFSLSFPGSGAPRSHTLSIPGYSSSSSSSWAFAFRIDELWLQQDSTRPILLHKTYILAQNRPAKVIVTWKKNC